MFRRSHDRTSRRPREHVRDLRAPRRSDLVSAQVQRLDVRVRPARLRERGGAGVAYSVVREVQITHGRVALDAQRVRQRHRLRVRDAILEETARVAVQMDVPNVIARVLRERLDVRVEGVDERRDGSTSPRRALGEVRRPESRCRG